MSKWGLSYKGTEILSPEEWNRLIDALEELDGRAVLERNGGIATFTGDGVTSEFMIAHGLSTSPTIAFVAKATSGLPDIDYWTADTTYIHVYFKSPPTSGVEIKLWWIAIRL